MTTEILKHDHQAEILPTLLTWFFLIAGLSLNRFFITEQGELPLNLLMSAVISIGLFYLAYFQMPKFRSFVLNLDMRLLIMLHSWRTLGLGFIFLYYVGELPALFAFPAGLGDAMVAVGAVFLTYSLFTNSKGVSKKTVWRWNTFAVLDFVVAVSLGVLTRTDALLFQPGTVSSDAMTTFPFVLVPAFLVQIFAITHIIIYLQLMNNYKDQNVIRF